MTRTLHLDPRIRGDFKAPLFAAAGMATVGVRDGKPFYKVRQGTLAVEHLVFRGRAGGSPDRKAPSRAPSRKR